MLTDKTLSFCSVCLTCPAVNKGLEALQALLHVCVSAYLTVCHYLSHPNGPSLMRAKIGLDTFGYTVF